MLNLIRTQKKDKFNRVDILVRDDKDERIIVEIQNNKDYDYLQRILFGAAKTLTENIDEGQPYSTIKKVISVSVVYFEAGQGIDYIYHGQTVFTGMHQKDMLMLSEEQRSIASHNETLQKDMEDAKEQAKYQARYQAAEKGLRKNLSVEDVADINDLPIEMVLEIKREIDNDQQKA